MNRLFARRKHRKSRGVAVIFTLGILGLLTVMALGFASTALLNRKIAENSSVQTYARTIARNVALPRALFALRKGVPYGKIHSTKSASNVNGDPDSSSKDFLWTLDTLLDSRKGPIIYTTTTSGTDYTTSAEWQYVYSPVKQTPTDTKFPIIGRFAYVAFPDHGRMDPSVNLGSIDADKRYGSTEKELSLPIRSTDWNTQLKGKLENSNRWQSFNEIFSFLNIADSGSDDSRSMYQDGIGMNHSPASETFWVDLNKDGKQTKDEMFLRFNMTRDWTSTTVDQLIGEGAEPLTLDNAGASKSNTFIPWLKYWEKAVNSDWTADRMKKQIAANIIQYNLDKSLDTVSDVAPASWATAATGPTYAGIGQHPMLNEIGFLVSIGSNLKADPIKDGENIVAYTYTLTYFIYADVGAELVYPFGPGTGLESSEVNFTDTANIQVVLRGLIPNPEGDAGTDETAPDNLISSYTMTLGKTSSVSDRSDITAPPLDFSMEFSGNSTDDTPAGPWQKSPAYTDPEKFWKCDRENKYASSAGKTVQEVKFILKVNSSTDLSSDLKDKLGIEKITFNPGCAVLTYNGKPRDYANLVAPNPKFKEFPVESLMAKPSVGTADAQQYQVSVSYEAKDPLVNHYPSDWTSPSEPLPDPQAVTEVDPSVYPGTSGTAGKGPKNNTISAGKLLDLDEPVNGTIIQEAATDPAYTTGSRLSTSYIRHGQMKSLWELGFISRAEAFRTLNLAKTKIFEPSAISDLKAGGFAEGDANILDQVKFSDTISDDQLYKYGKISLNSKNHNVFQQVFNTDVSWYESLRTFVPPSIDKTSPFDDTTVTASNAVCSNSDCRKMIPCADPASCPHKYVSAGSPGCLAHLLLDRSSILPFFNRSDLLVEPTAPELEKLPGYSALSSDQKDKLAVAQENLRDWLLRTKDTTTLCKTEKEQYAARFMHLFSTEPVNRVYIIIVAQTIKDIGGSPAFVDWNGDGDYDPSNDGVSISESAKFLKTGYVRKKLDASGYQRIGIGSDEKVKETITTTTIGTYDYGADKITGETKLIVEMQKDIFTNKWRIAGYRYVD